MRSIKEKHDKKSHQWQKWQWKKIFITRNDLKKIKLNELVGSVKKKELLVEHNKCLEQVPGNGTLQLLCDLSFVDSERARILYDLIIQTLTATSKNTIRVIGHEHSKRHRKYK